MRKQTGKLSLLVVYLLIFATGCGAVKYLGFGMASINLQPSKTMNLGNNGSPLPTIVRIYQLKSKYKMEKADFKSLWRNDKVVLDDTLLEKKEVTVYPGQKQEIKIEKKDEARFIGIVAIFRKPNEETNGWKHIAELTSWTIGSQDIQLIVGKDELKIGILEEEKNR